MARNFDPKVNRTPVALAVMVGFHAGVAWLVLSGLGREAVELVKRPLTATIIEEVKVPEPPPPPPPPKPIKQVETPKVEAPPPPPFVPPPEIVPPQTPPAAVAMETTSSTTAEPVVIAPPPPPEPLVPAPARMDIGVACPQQVPPEIPARAARDGVGGVVRAQITVRDGLVRDVQVLSGPKAFHDAVRAAMSRYRCATPPNVEVLAIQDFKFEVR